MSVQTKILLLLLAIVSTLIGGLVIFNLTAERKFRALAASRATERNRIFDAFLVERGDALKALVDDMSIWNDMVLAIAKDDARWAEGKVNEERLATYKANAVWIYKSDRSLFYSLNNRYADNLRELPLSRDALNALFETKKACHFFVHVPQGWMEIRGGTIHQSVDPLRESPPQGYFFAGQIWIDENIRQMSRFTGYEIQILPFEAAAPGQASREEAGLITFSRDLPGWNDHPVARVVVRNDSPIIRELNRASQRLFICLLLFSVGLFLALSLALIIWVRRPLHRLTRSLETGDGEMLAPLRRRGDEFGLLADLLLKFRSTEEALLQSEDRLRHAQKLEAVGRLAGGVAHDFNNLLTAIIGYAELLEARLAGDDGNREFAHLIGQAGGKAAALTKQLLAFSRRQLLRPRILELNSLVRELEKLLQRIIGEHIRIYIDTRAADARVLADSGQLEQVILNLGVNARDAMPKGGDLIIATENRMLIDAAPDLASEPPPAGYVCLIVSDTGMGMDAQTKERLFEPFFTTKGPGKGTGLGLATVYGIVKQSGGEIRVESKLGSGSKFLIYFPRQTEPIEDIPSFSAPIVSAPNFETILVVEDEEVVRQLMCAVLSDAGYCVLCAGSPSEALEMLAGFAGPIHLLVTDVVMPEMHGPTLAQEILALRSEVKVLFVSGYSENDISDQGVVEPGLDVLQKPFFKANLLQKVRDILDGGGGGSLE